MTPPKVPIESLPHGAKHSPCLEKLDRQGWADGFAFENFGLRIGVRVNDPSILPELLTLPLTGHRKLQKNSEVDVLYSLRKGPETGVQGRRNYHLLHDGHIRLARTLDFDFAVQVLREHLPASLAGNAPQGLFLRAGAVAWRGKAFVLTSSPGKGASTLINALVDSGAEYMSDQYTVITEDGMVHPILDDLLVRGSDEPTKIRAEDMKSVADRPLPLAFVLHCNYDESGIWDPQPVSAADRLFELMSKAAGIRIRPVDIIKRVRSFSDRFRLFRSSRSDSALTVPKLLEFLDLKMAQEAN